MFTATTILAVKKDGQTAVAGDGQVTMGNAVVMKNTARRCAACIMERSSPDLPVPWRMHLPFLINLKGNFPIAMEIWCVLPWSSPKSGGGIGCSKSWKLF